jgi:hypothetical protein
MIQTFLEWLCTRIALWCCELGASHFIFRQGQLYLGRWYLLGGDGHGRAPGWRGQCQHNLFLHHFWMSDPDGLHNHPYRKSRSLILTGGYWEWRRKHVPGHHEVIFQQGKHYPPGSVNTIRADDFHRVVLCDMQRGVWTLFFAGKKHGRGWGFLDPVTGIFRSNSGARD